MLVKVCGLREADNIRAVEEAGADWMGFIFYEKSPRYVAARPAYLPEAERRIGVFVSAGADDILRRAEAFGLRGVQLHGACSPQLCRRLRSEGLGVIRALPATENLNDEAAPYADCCDAFLFDTPCESHGGSGKRFDWSLLANYRLDTPFLLSGGLSPESLPALCRWSHPRWAGIDLNSGFETAPGRKDAGALKNFIPQFKSLSHESHTISFPEKK